MERFSRHTNCLIACSTSHQLTSQVHLNCVCAMRCSAPFVLIPLAVSLLASGCSLNNQASTPSGVPTRYAERLQAEPIPGVANIHWSAPLQAVADHRTAPNTFTNMRSTQRPPTSSRQQRSGTCAIACIFLNTQALYGLKPNIASITTLHKRIQ